MQTSRLRGPRSVDAPLTNLGSSPCHTAVDLAAKRNKIDGLGQERLGSAFQGFSPGIRVAVGGDHNDGDVGSTGRLWQGVQHLLQIEGSAADHLQNIGRRGLLLKRFPKLVKQSGVLDRDYRLLGEIAQQLNLLVGEGADLLSIDRDCADQLGVPKHGYNDKRPSPSEIR